MATLEKMRLCISKDVGESIEMTNLGNATEKLVQK